MKHILISLLLLTSTNLYAQQAGSPFTGFANKPNQPINFEADRAEVFDSEKRAVLTGNVKVVQGESTLQSARLIMHYDGQKDPNAPAPQAGANPNSSNPIQSGSVSKFFMEGNVSVKSTNQVATADKGFYDAKANMAELTGNVVLTQCSNVMRGDKLVVNLKTNQATLSSAGKGSRVSGMLVQNAPNPQPGCEGNTPTAAPAKPKAGTRS